MPDTLSVIEQQGYHSSDTKRVESELAQLLEDLGAAPSTSDRVRPLHKLDDLKWVNPHLPIGWPVMPKGLPAKFVAYWKKVLRLALRWYINPLVDQQNDYNEVTADALQMLYKEISRLQTRVFDLEARLEQAEGLDVTDHRRAI